MRLIKALYSNKKEGEMVNKDTKEFFKKLFFMIVAFAFGGAGLGILFNSEGDLVSIIGGFILIGIAISVIYKIIENG